MKSGIHARHRVVLTKVLTGLIACVIAFRFISFTVRTATGLRYRVYDIGEVACP